MATFPCQTCGSTQRDDPSRVASLLATRCPSCDNIIEPKSESVSVEQAGADEARLAEAMKCVQSHGYTEDEAKGIIAKYGVDRILSDEAKDQREQAEEEENKKADEAAAVAAQATLDHQKPAEPAAEPAPVAPEAPVAAEAAPTPLTDTPADSPVGDAT